MFTTKFLRTMLYLILAIVIVGVLFALVSNVGAQETTDAGRGVIIEAAPINAANPGWCSGEGCDRFSRLTIPLLFGIDPATQMIAPASSNNMGLVLDPPPQPETEQTYHLRDDLQWSNGTPITAYDVLYNLILDYVRIDEKMISVMGLAHGARIESDFVLTLEYPAPNCISQTGMNTLIANAQTTAPHFSDFVHDVQSENDGILSWQEWADAYKDWNQGSTLHYPSSPETLLTSSDGFSLHDAFLPNEVRLSRGDLAYVMRHESTNSNRVNRFLAGETNVLTDIPIERRADIRATNGIQVYEQSGYEMDYLLFNLSDPNYPRDAFVDGEPLEQLPHPFFADVRVRRAVQLALDPQEMVDVALAGSGMVSGSVFPPASWVYDPATNVYDPAEAKRLLDEAGWRDIDGDGIRECYHCLYAREGAPLNINLTVFDDPVRWVVSDLIRVQLRRVGMDVYTGSGTGSGQQFDMLLITAGFESSTGSRDPDLIRIFLSPEWDFAGLPNASYNNPRFDALLEQARTVSTCAIDERAALYHEAQAILLEEVPAVWLYTRNDMYVARGIEGFAPYPGDPFWNIFSWVVIP